MELANHFVGRSAELERLDEVLDAVAATGHASAVQVVGPGGIGKTRLLAAFAEHADARGHLVLRGSGADLERDLAHWVFIDALDEYLESVEPHRLHRLGDEVRQRLADVFPALSAPGAAAAAPPDGERHRTHRAVRALLGQLAATKPLVLILDDVHWADEASVDLLVSLLHRPPSAAMLLVLGTRASEGSPRLGAAAERALREGTLHRVELGGLSGTEVAEMLGRAAPDPSTAALFDDSGGNPFYVEQLVRAGGGERVAADGWVASAELPVPPMVRAAMVEELSALEDRDRRLLDGASVAGDPFELELAAAAADLSEGDAMDAIDALIAKDLVRLTDVPRRFRFRHPILRRAIYDATPGGWRIGAHQRTADALRGAAAGVEVLAHHVDRSAKSGDLAAVAILRDAGQRSAQRAPATGARWFTAALRLLPTTAPVDERVELLLAAAACLAATGRFAEAHALLIESLEIVPAEPRSLRLHLTGRCAAIEHLLGLHDQAHHRLAAALDALEEQGPEAIGLMIELAGDALFRLDYDAAADWGQRAVTDARTLGDGAITAAALAILARTLAWGSQVEPAQVVRAEAAAMIDRLPDEQFALQLTAAVDLCGADIYLDEFADAATRAERVLVIGRATRQTQRFPGVYATLGVARCMLGRLEEAVHELDLATEAARASGNPQALAWALFCRAFVALPAGDTALAIAAARESLALADEGGQRVIAARAGAVLAGALLDAGQLAEAEAAVGSVEDHVELLPPVWRVYIQELMTRCWLEFGRPAEAQRAAAGARASADAVGLRLATAMADRAEARVAQSGGDEAGARDRALASVELADAVAAPVEASLSRMVAGRALAALGERAAAVDLLKIAATDLGRCGAIGHRNAAEQELRRLGERIHRRSKAGDAAQSGVGSLTARELEIARLIVDRRTNAEIAADLYLSKKTVETHIRNMFRKLDAGSRVDIARAVEQFDAAG